MFILLHQLFTKNQKLKFFAYVFVGVTIWKGCLYFFFELLTNKYQNKEIWNFLFCTWFLVVGWCNEINNYHSLFMSFKVCNPPHRDRCHGIFRMIRSVILLGNIHTVHIILLIIYSKFETDEMQLQVTNMQYACKQILCEGG